MPQSQTRYLVTVIANGRVVPGNWGLSGGRVTSEPIMDRAPGAVYPKASGSDKTIEPLTLTSRVEIASLTDAERARLTSLVSVEDAMVVNRKPLTAAGNPFGAGRTWTGTLTSGPEEDSDPNSDNEPAEVELEVQPSRVA